MPGTIRLRNLKNADNRPRKICHNIAVESFGGTARWNSEEIEAIQEGMERGSHLEEKRFLEEVPGR